MPGQPQRSFRRPRLRISVRGLLILVLLVGGWLGWIAQTARVQRDAVTAIERVGGEVRYDHEWQWKNGRPVWTRTTRLPTWLVERIGIDYLSSVTYVDLRYRGTDELLEQIGQLRRLKYLSLGGSPVSDAGMVHLDGLADLRWLSLSGTKVTDAGLVHLKRSTRLETLYLDMTRVGSSGLSHLEALRGLKMLSLDLTQVSDTGLSSLKALTGLRMLSVPPSVSAAGFEGLRRALPMTRIGGGIRRAGWAQARALELGEEAGKARPDTSPPSRATGG